MISVTSEKSSQKNKKSKIIRTILYILILLFLILAVDLYRSNNCIKVTTHALSEERVTSPLRIGIISDLHGKVYGDNNQTLLEKIKNEEPQIILVVGDMISRDTTDKETINSLSDFIRELDYIAPVYYSIGNHERFNPEFEKICEAVNSAGAELLSDEFRDLNIAGQNIRLGGITYYRFWDEDANAFLEAFSDTENYKLLMCHHPEFYQWGIKNYKIELTVSGHTHGGMVKLPLLGPLYAPEQGWFPEYGAGLYEEENGRIAVTTGLASSPSYLPRLFNRPEIMIIDLA